MFSGNFVGQKPYLLGAACTACSSGTAWCDDGLCNSMYSFISSFEESREQTPFAGSAHIVSSTPDGACENHNANRCFGISLN